MAFDRLLGEAYILMRADGSLIPKDAKDAGHAAGGEYSKAFDTELSKFEKDSLNRFRTKLAKSTAEIDFSDFRKQFGSVDDTVVALRKKMQGLRRDNALTASSYRAIKKSINEWALATKAMEAEQAKLNNQMVSFSATYRKGIEGMWKRYATDLATAARSGDFSKFRAQNEKTSLTVKRMSEELRKNAQYLGLTGEEIDDLVIKIDKWSRAQHAIDLSPAGRRVRQQTSAMSKGFDKVDDAANRFNVTFGKAFGKGSRNDFLNFTGSVIQGLSSMLTELPLRVARNVAHIGDAFGEAFSAGRAAELTRFASAGRGLAAVFGAGGGPVGIIIGGVAALAAFGIALPAIVSLVSGLVGAITALASAIVIGLIGALLPLIPLLTAAAVGFGVLAASILTFTKDDSMADWIKTNLSDPWKKFTKSIYPEIKGFIKFFMGGFDDMLADVKPGIIAFFKDFKTRLGDKETRDNLNKLSDSMGKIFTNLARSAPAFLDGLIAFFVQITPYAEKLSKYILDLGNRFSKWANSKPGQDSIASFMETAWLAGKKLWGIIVTIGEIIGEVFFAGTPTGTSFLDSILTKLEGIKTFLETETGKKALSDWFSSAKGIGEDIGRIALKIGEIMDYLDSPTGRENAQRIMDAILAIAGTATMLASVADEVGTIVGWITKPVFVSVLELMNSILGKSDNTGTQPFKEGAKSDAAPGARGPMARGNSAAAQQARADLARQLPQKELLRQYLVKIKVDDLLYKEKRQAIEDFVFRGKTVTVKGNEALWNATKGTIAGFVFEPKTVEIIPIDKELRAWVEKWNRTNLDKTATIRYAVDGKLPNGGRGLGGGVTSGNSARGRVVTGPHYGWTGEAGPEAIVPLDRPLNMVDPSVRALSAIAQGLRSPMAPMASGGIAGAGGGQIIVAEGAVQVTTGATNPAAVGTIVLNRLGDTIAAAAN